NVVDETDKVEHFAEGIFKTYVAAEPMYFDIKNKQGFEARPTARILIISNERPQINDKTDGIWARMLHLPFQKSYVDKENYNLAKILESEISGILNWALIGLDRLRKQDRFTEPAISKEAKEQYKAESNPAKKWLAETFEPDPK